MIDRFFKYKDLFKKISERLGEEGYVVDIKYNKKDVVRIGDVSPSLFGVFGSVRIVDMEKALELAKKMTGKTITPHSRPLRA